MDTFGINIDNFNLKPDFFNHQSTLHGIDHTYRVMCHVLKIGSFIKYPRETRLAFFGGYIHDMARKDDGKCSEHGKWSADEKLPAYIPLFKENGLNENEIPELYDTVAFHSIPQDLPHDHPHFITSAILKDADALDRIRIHRFDLKLKYLRFDASKDLVEFAKEVYYDTRKCGYTTFREYFDYLCTKS